MWMEEKLSKWPERTSTSPITRRTLSLYQCLLQEKKDASPEDIEDPNSHYHKASAILDIHHRILALAVKYEHSYARWKEQVSCLLEKIPGMPKQHKLRVIHLYEADYNMLVGDFWAKRLIWHLENLRDMAVGCYGTRKGLSAHEPIFAENLQTSIAYSSRTNMAIDDRDAKSCYDRIPPNLFLLLSRRAGIPESMIKILSQTLDEAKYHLNTAMGISDEFYSHTNTSRVYGTGQGSTISPSAWAIVCSVLFKAHRRGAHGATYISPDEVEKILLTMTGFVDDTKGQVNDMMDERPASMDELRQRIQADCQLWSDALHVSGGRLEHSKSYFYIVHWGFKDRGEPFLHRDKLTMDLWDWKRERCTTVEAKDPFEARRSLGVHLCPGRSQKVQEDILTNLNLDFVQTLASIPCTPFEGWRAYMAFYLPKVCYPLQNSFLSRDFLEGLQKVATPTLLQKCGFNRTFPRLVVFGCPDMGGLGFRLLFIEQTILMLLQTMKHLRSPDQQCHSLVIIALKWAQHQLGTGTFFLEDTQTPLPHLECKMWKVFREGLATVKGSLRIHPSLNMVHKVSREGDAHLLDLALEAYQRKELSGREVEEVGFVRLFQKVTTLSDICTIDGREIQAAYFDCRPVNAANRPSIRYSRQPWVSEQAKTSWRKFLRRTVLRRRSPDDGLKYPLTTPLGKWLPLHIHSMKWTHYVTEEYLFQRVGQSYRKHLRHGTTRRMVSYAVASGTWCAELPSHAHPIQVVCSRDGCWYKVQLAHIQNSSRGSDDETPYDLTSRINRLDDSLASLLRHAEFCRPIQEVVNLLRTADSITIMGDGGAVANNAGFGLVIAAGTEVIIKIHGKVQGDDPKSYRAESYAWAAGTLVLRVLHDHFDITGDPSQEADLGSDNQGLVTRISLRLQWTFMTPMMTLKSEYDVEAVIMDNLHYLSRPFNLVHVKGHQDATTAVENLPFRAQLNVEADRLATHAYTTDPTHVPFVPLFPQAVCAFDIDGVTITRNLKGKIRSAASRQKMEDYLMERSGWSFTVLSSIDWDAHRGALNHSRDRRTFTLKLIHRWLPIGRRITWYDKKYDPSCFACGRPEEDQDHWMLCMAGNDRMQWRIKLLTNTRAFLAGYMTDSDFAEYIVTVLDRVLKGQIISVTGRFGHIARDQQRIGWTAFLRGYWASAWQQEHRELCRSKPLSDQAAQAKRLKMADSWAGNFITMLWQDIHSLWLLRNGERHGTEEESKRLRKRQQDERELRLIYEEKASLPLEVQHVMFDSLDKHLEEGPQKVGAWLRTFRDLIKISHQKQSLLAVI